MKFSPSKILLVPCFIIISISFISAEDIDEKLTPSEQEALKKLQLEIENLVHNKYQSQPQFLIGFLRATNLNVDQAKDMIIKTMEWRKQKNVDGILSEKKMYDLIQRFPINIGKAVDRKGRPALQPTLGSWDLRKAMIAGDRDLLSRFQIFWYESMVTKTRELGKLQWIFFIDMSGYNTRQHACLACIPFFFDLLTTYETYYPNTIRHFFLLNTLCASPGSIPPRVFEGLLNIIKPLMAPTTRRDMQIFGYNKAEWKQEILKHFAPEQLTPLYGGTRKSFD